MVDYRWMSSGGLLIDGSGDIQLTDPSIPESLVDMVNTVLKADRNSWQLYNIGANLSYFIGQTIDEELELKIKRAITDSLVRAGVLPRGSFVVETLVGPEAIVAITYIANTAVAKVTVPRNEEGQITVE